MFGHLLERWRGLIEEEGGPGEQNPRRLCGPALVVLIPPRGNVHLRLRAYRLSRLCLRQIATVSVEKWPRWNATSVSFILKGLSCAREARFYLPIPARHNTWS